MVNPLIIVGLVLLIGGGGAVVTHTIVNPDSPITESLDELVCNLTGSFEQFNDPDCPQYQTNNEPDPTTNATQQSLLDPQTWTPLSIAVVISILSFVLLRQRQTPNVMVVRSRY